MVKKIYFKILIFLYYLIRTLQPAYEGLFPKDDPKNTRFAINFFTSIGLGGLTDELIEHLKTRPKPVAVPLVPEPTFDKDESSSFSNSPSFSSDSSSSPSSTSSSSGKYYLFLLKLNY